MKVSQLKDASDIKGDEFIHVVQNGFSRRAQITDLVESGLFATPGNGGGDGGPTGPVVAATTQPYTVVPSASTVGLGNYKDTTVHQVTLDRTMSIELPDVSTLPATEALTITVRIDQTAVASLSWTSTGKTIIWDNPSWYLPGAGKSCVFSFMIFGGTNAWFASLVWMQA